MKLQQEEQRVLREALMVLSGGDARLFLDMMWLGFGDQWTPLMDMLASHGYVVVPDEDSYDGVRITEKGVQLAQHLQGKLAKTA
jgi:hypothetical protein